MNDASAATGMQRRRGRRHEAGTPRRRGRRHEAGTPRCRSRRLEAGTPRRRSRRHEAGNTLLVLAAVLTLLVVGGGMNYVRNLKADDASEQTRPFHGYEKDDLIALKAAYEMELAQFGDRYQAQRAQRRKTGRKAMMDESVADFERVREHTSQVRDLGAEVAEREARIREIDRELAARAEIGEGWDAHLRRLTRF